MSELLDRVLNNEIEPEILDQMIRNNEVFENSLYYAKEVVRNDNNIRFLKSRYEYFAKMLGYICIENKALVSTALIFIEYTEYKIYLYTIYHLFVRGLQHKAFKGTDNLNVCNIPDFDFRLNILPYTVCNLGTDLALNRQKKDYPFEYLNYNIDSKSLNIIDVALILDDKDLIKQAMDLGFVNTSTLEFKAPGLVNHEQFYIDIINLSCRLERYKISLKEDKEWREKARNNNVHESSSGIYNILTGERVYPQGGTFYIDDFR